MWGARGRAPEQWVKCYSCAASSDTASGEASAARKWNRRAGEGRERMSYHVRRLEVGAVVLFCVILVAAIGDAIHGNFTGLKVIAGGLGFAYTVGAIIIAPEQIEEPGP